MTTQHPPQGTLYDLAYRRYEGVRRGPTWRFFVIVRQAVASQFRSRWVKALLVLGLIGIALTDAGVAFGLLQGAATHAVTGSAVSARVDAIVGEHIVAGGSYIGFLLVLVGGAAAISSDLNAGAFQFYFSRPISRPQYLLARVLGTAVWPLLLATLTMVTLVGVQAALSDPPQHALLVGAKAVGPMVLRVLVVAAIASGVSSLTRRRGLAQALFAGIIVASFLVTSLIAAVSHQSWIAAFGPTSAAEAVGAQLFGSTDYAGWHAAVPGAACAAWIAVFIALAAWRLSRAEVVRG